MDSNALLARLESVTARLEAVARKQGGGGDDDEVPPYVTDWQTMMNTDVAEFNAICEKVACKHLTPLVNKAYQNVADLLAATAACKKPKNQKDVIDFLKPAVDVIKDAEQVKRKRSKKADKHNAAFYESIVGISWVSMSPPYGLPLEHIKAQADAAQFHLNKILKTAKDLSGDEKTNQQAFCKSLKKCMEAQVGFVKNYFKTGLSWNPKGGELSEYSPGNAPAAAAKAAAPAPAAEPAPAKKAPAKKKAAGGGAAAIFGELKKKAAGGDSAATGMKKVTRDMKNKYKDPKERSGKVVMKAKKAAVKKPSKPPSQTNRGGSWMIENYYEPEVVEVTDKITTKQNAYIANCSNCTLVVKQKVKAITIDSCQKARVFINGVLATVELVNCKSVTVVLQKAVPAIQLDKCSSPRIIVTKDAVSPLPKIISSNITAGNIEIPGKTDNDDPVEIPLPEQFETKIDLTGNSSTAPVEHG